MAVRSGSSFPRRKFNTPACYYVEQRERWQASRSTALGYLAVRHSSCMNMSLMILWTVYPFGGGMMFRFLSPRAACKYFIDFWCHQGSLHSGMRLPF